jgi:hypothetical protein
MKADKNSVRKFGTIFTVILLLIGTWLWYQDNAIWIWFAGAAAVMLLIAVTATGVLTPLYKGMTIFAIVIGYFVSRIILTLMFVIFFVPIGLFMRLVGKDLLDKKLNKQASTYWLKKENTPFSKEKYERLF